MRKAEIIIALDVASSAEIPAIVESLPDEIRFYKIGLELFCAEGPAALRPLRERNRKIFLDLKLHDIPRTVERAARSVAALGVDLLTVHACGGQAMLEAAAAGAAAAGNRPPSVIAVTTLTSLGQEDLHAIGITRTLPEQALALAEMAIAAGLQGVVTSVLEAARLRQQLGGEALLVTPGIRLPTHDNEDQKRVATPFEAVRAGADYLVVGRPILEAAEPRRAAAAILADMRLGSCSPA